MKGFAISGAGWGARCGAMLACAAAIAACTWPLAPKYLFYFDNVNFALALEDFDPGRHQPQPPGYPLFVALARFFHWFVRDVNHVFLLCGAIGGASALILAWWLGEQMFGPRAGFAAALLLIFNPAFWFAGVTAQVRVFLASLTLAVAAAAWQVWQGNEPRRWFLLSAAVLGLGAGFRPAALTYLTPLVFLAGWKSRRTAREFAAAAAVLILAVSAWMIPMWIEVGGPAEYARLVRRYTVEQAGATSLLLGADTRSWWSMAESVLVWNGLGVLTWIWAVPLFRTRPDRQRCKGTGSFLLAACLPAFLFQVLVHTGDPGHTLSTGALLCLVGGRVISNRRRVLWAAAVAANIFLFFRPVSPLARTSTYRMVKYVDRVVSSTLDALVRLRAAGPVFVVWNNSPVTWRHLAYYFPEDPLLVLDAREPWLMRHGNVAEPPKRGSDLALPAHVRIIWLGGSRGDLPKLGAGAGKWGRAGAVSYFESPPGLRFKHQGLSFATVSLQLRP